MNQLSQLLETFTAHQTSTGSDSFSHTGGLGSALPQLASPTVSGPGRFGEGGSFDNGATFLVIMVLAIMMFFGTGLAPRNRQDEKIRGTGDRDRNFDRDYFD